MPIRGPAQKQLKGAGAAQFMSFSDVHRRNGQAGSVKTVNSGLSVDSLENQKLVRKLTDLCNMLTAEDRSELLECIAMDGSPGTIREATGSDEESVSSQDQDFSREGSSSP